MKRFNTTAVCIPSNHYMVDLSERVKEIRKLVDSGKYFAINRARQYGKTTTLVALQSALKQDYIVIRLSFEGITEANFASEQSFVKAFCRLLKKNSSVRKVMPKEIGTQIDDYISRADNKACMDELFVTLRDWCSISDKPIVLLIDEVDQGTNNQVFLDFLGLLRDDYINRDTEGEPSFQSVVLAGVTDVKHLKSKIRPEDSHKTNSPWNIAADFNIDMSLSCDGIKGMLEEYEADHHTGMNTKEIAEWIHDYTSGYPYLVSRICEHIDVNVSSTMGLTKAWSRQGIDEAIKLILSENNSLFQSLTKNLDHYPDLKSAIRSILMEGTKLTWNAQQDSIVQMKMFGLIKNVDNTVRVANRIFETVLYNLFLSDEELKSNIFSREGSFGKNRFVQDGRLNMPLVLEGFIETYTQVFGPLKDRFKEKDGRELFLLYLKPIINGTGNYYIEAQTRDQTRTDVIVDYLMQQFVIELKIWHGERYNAEGEKQIIGYLEHWKLDTGYMLSFNFNKKKKQGVEVIRIGNKILYEGTV